MVTLNDIKRECSDLGSNLFIMPYNDNSVLYSLADKFVVVTQDWIDALDVDDNAFSILLKIGECCFYEYSDDERECKGGALDYAINTAKKYSLQITRNKKIESLEEYGFNENIFDFSDICLESTIIELIERHGLPLKLTMPRYYGDFYYIAEKNNTKKHKIEGTQYHNGKEYRKKSYSYNEVCMLFERIECSQEMTDEATDDKTYNDSIKKRIQNKDSFDEVEVNNDCLLNHQKAGLLLSERYDKFAFFYDTGTGKTVMTLSVIKSKQDKEDARFLILAPKAIIKTAWIDDTAEFFPSLKILPLSNNFNFADRKELYQRWEKYAVIQDDCVVTADEWERADEELDFDDENWLQKYNKKMELRNSIWERIEEAADHYIVNIEKFRYDPDAIMDYYDINGLIVDESAILKNPESKSAKTLFTYADDFDYIYLLSGKPAPNNSTEFYAQMKLVDPNTFSMSFNKFKSEYFTGSGSKIKPASAKAEDDVANMVAKRSLIVSKEDCLQLMETYQEIRSFELPEKIMEQYDRLYRFCIFELQADSKREKGAFYSSVCKLAIFTKLREIASGFLIDEYGDTVGLHNLKTDELISIVNENPDEQIIVWCQFEYEIKAVEKALSRFGEVVTAYGKTKNIDDSIKRFKNGKAKYIVAHPKSIKYGVTFIQCNIAVYYSMSYSAEDYYQSRDRIHRLGQKRTCSYYFIQAENTIDEIMYEAVSEKMSYAEIFAVIVKQAAKHGIQYQNFKEMDEVPEKDELISTQTVKSKYEFSMVDDVVFEYKNGKQKQEGRLYNTLLRASNQLRPEEILFEIGHSIRIEELYQIAEKDKSVLCISYKDVVEISKWVLDEMKQLNIKRIQKVYDYLEEQIQKQYEIDVANGAEQIKNLDVLSLLKKEKSKKTESSEKIGKKKFMFGTLGIGKKRFSSLMSIRKEIDEIFFDSGNYRITHECFCGDDSVAHCHPDLKLIYQSRDDYENVTPESLFDLLHEIGHLENNADNMTRQEEEFFATQWALERMKLYDFKLPKKRQKEFEAYINGYSSRRNKYLKGKNATDLNWDD